MSDEKPIESVVHDATRAGRGDKVTLSDLLHLYGHRSFGPIFVILGLITALIGVPGVPTTIGITLLLFSSQMLLGRSHVWVPGFVRDLSISRERLKKAEEKSGPFLYGADSVVADRLEWATSGKARYAAAVLVSLLALTLIPLELIPFAGALPGIAIMLVGAALMARDGLLMIAAYGFAGAALFVLLRYSPILGWFGLGGAGSGG